VRIGFLPFFQIWRQAAGLLLLLDRAFPGLVGLFAVFPVRRLPGIVLEHFSAHARLHLLTPKVGDCEALLFLAAHSDPKTIEARNSMVPRMSHAESTEIATSNAIGTTKGSMLSTQHINFFMYHLKANPRCGGFRR
jgi:hypothetical protein